MNRPPLHTVATPIPVGFLGIEHIRFLHLNDSASCSSRTHPSHIPHACHSPSTRPRKISTSGSPSVTNNSCQSRSPCPSASPSSCSLSNPTLLSSGSRPSSESLSCYNCQPVLRLVPSDSMANADALVCIPPPGNGDENWVRKPLLLLGPAEKLVTHPQVQRNIARGARVYPYCRVRTRKA
ncbi:hypothetical protein BT96DRAFT_915865 [Gymnopus androsaceus JB14]|uniref:Uncharacterized protein n=1 Tax=Gymnopus androsaceus JB14 TaxID=1447944 RepID=A0A6A4I6S2_9AGAR|nr:hypothetical protein BT96DRAFT_915865 [Gymnopus androsaceus JB14]